MEHRWIVDWPAALVLAAALLVSGCGASPSVAVSKDDQAQSVAEPVLTPGEGRARAILNAGVMGEAARADTTVKFLFDPLYDDHFGSLEELPDSLVETIVAGDPPYDGVSLVFVTHAHGDHFSARHLSRMMAAQPRLRMIAPTQALEKLQEAQEWESTFADRVTALSLENGEQTENLTIDGVEIEAFRSPHSGWPDRHADVHNFTFRVSVPVATGRVMRVMHVGDADPDPVHFEPHESFLSRARTGLVIVPFWFARNGVSPDTRQDQLNAASVVAVHVPQREPAWLAQSDWSYFTQEGQLAPVTTTEP